MLLLLALACGHPKDDTSHDSGTDTGQDSGQLDTATCVDMDGDLGTPEAPGCAGAGGVCIGDQAACGAGTLQPDFDSECTFDDGSGFCCVPPEPAASGDSCAASGGVCAPIAGCGMTQGWYTPNGGECTDQYGVGAICCAPHDACEGWGVVSCCSNDGTAAYVAECDHGTLGCSVGQTTLGCDDDCAAYGD